MTAIRPKQVLVLTEPAVEQIKLLLKKSQKPVVGIRIGVKSGGCSGYSYYFEYADEKKPFDEVIEQHGVTILIDPKALMYLIGTEMDYHNDQFKSGFVFVNPNEKGRCGCGKSFNV
ncbi:Iron-binding protein IscA [Candidatus Trichorickettsia mobilis]|uniref:Iron-binding protein IscA n=1 Tax=Candidatus Trichorickettsia mobilis TaxID=1346319 RepID=A0ABZ0USH6_9RICK|nr:iron-sulfur cluster assembly accessory protein [Candidatus Trichorickettsia mobilis]WPY00978.1 Iron-binding protein IscA [Candidatus Trichorickettsia mobilis]